MLPQEVDASSGLWSNNSSNASLNEYTLPNATSSSTSLQQQEHYQNGPSSLGLSDISVSDILEVYKHDTELLKHILLAKTEEDKRRTAEEVRRAEEARLQTKYLDLNWEQRQHFSDPSTFTNEFLSGSLGSLAVSSAEAIPDWLSIDPGNTMATLSPSPITTSLTYFDQNPPSPTTTSPSPFVTTSFDAPFAADLSKSVASSPESLTSFGKIPRNSNKATTTATNSSSSLSSSSTTTLAYSAVDSNHQQDNTSHTNGNNYSQQSALPYEATLLHAPASAPENNTQPAKSACKRTLSRTRSQRRPVVAPGKKKNRPIPLPQQPSSTTTTPTLPVKDENQLDHVTVMEALRAKLRRSSNPPAEAASNSTTTGGGDGNNKNNKLIWPTSLEEIVDPPQPMSPQGMLLLDLKNPRRIFPNNNNNKRTMMNPKVAVLRRPKPFTSAHNHCEKSKDASTTTAVSIK
ncbi:hypothetical protein BCR42DRAFT_492941 [Absidia repens]|uniref:Uncharacterized protein n=1 Tax=Absidia repens TaxID=90262 RepID=A0A1X2IBT5_9FUNG|nr:hypothetical protein BCR42DRAFT_492941 [Absidia repens]